MRWSCSTLSLALALAGGCAGGVTPDDFTSFGPASSPSQDEGTTSVGDDEGTTTLAEQEDDDIGMTTAPAEDDGTTGAVGGDTTDGGDSTGDGGPMGNCADPGTCQGAGSIGIISGDQGSPGLQSSSSQPAWRTFFVSENDDAITGTPMSFTVTLNSPAGADFDLIVYRGIEGGATGCGGFMQQSTTTGVDQISMTWGEGAFANGADDGAWVAVEIVAKDDMCAPPQEWTLTVEGNT